MGRLKIAARVWLQKLFNRAGYRIERLVDPTEPIDIFDLALRKTAAERGAEFFFVQIGANDGVAFDPIRPYVEEYHWSGLLVEPQPGVFERLKQNYASESNLQFVNAAIARENGRRKLYTVATDGNETGMAGFSRELLIKQIPAGMQVVELEVPTITMEDLLTTNGVRSIDLLQIDVEGYDFEILKMLDFDRWLPAVIHYEHRHLGHSNRNACENMLHARGYRFHNSYLDTTAVLQRDKPQE